MGKSICFHALIVLSLVVCCVKEDVGLDGSFQQDSYVLKTLTKPFPVYDSHDLLYVFHCGQNRNIISVLSVPES